jgi:hypothetical protein
VVLVTHDMTTVQGFCHRAMLLEGGELAYIGNPEQAAREYLRLNFQGPDADDGQPKVATVPDIHARLVDAWLENGDGQRIANIEAGEPIRFRAVVEAQRELQSPVFGFHCINPDGVHLFGFNRRLDVDEGQPDRLEAGQRVRIAGAIENPLTPGRYVVSCWLARARDPGDYSLQAMKLVDFVVFSAKQMPGLVSVRADVKAIPERRDRS